MQTAHKQLRGVAVGAGYFSQYHLNAWRQIPQVELAALCDLNLQRAEARCNEFKIPRCYTEIAAMLDGEQPDFVDIITGPETHQPLCAEAAARGIAIICQKPLAPTFDEAKQIVAETTAANVPFMVHENFRFQPWHREIRRLIDSGTIGRQPQTITVCCRMGDGWPEDAYVSRQPYFRTMPRMLIHETGVHFIDTFRFLFGEVARVYARLRRLNPHIRGEDTGVVLLEFQSGACGLISATRYHESDTVDPRYTFGEFTVDGDGGTIHVDLDGTLTIKRLGEPVQSHNYVHHNIGFAGDCVLPTQRHFVTELLGARQFESSGPEYLNTLTVEEAVYESAELGQPVDVPRNK
jgi:predicted dehydrogenase